MSDILKTLLDRARKNAQIAQAAALKHRAAGKSPAAKARDCQKISQDFATRLAERGRFRELLKDDRLDGERFRWYFSRIENGRELDELRRWIDRKMEKKRALP